MPGGPEPPQIFVYKAGSFRRLFAFAIDILIPAIVFWLVLRPIGLVGAIILGQIIRPGLDVATDPGIAQSLNDGIVPLVLFCYAYNHMWLEGMFGQSYGRKLTRTRLVRKGTDDPIGWQLAAIRVAAFSAFTLLPCPYAWLLWPVWALLGMLFTLTSFINVVMIFLKRDTLQDRILGTQVIYTETVEG